MELFDLFHQQMALLQGSETLLSVGFAGIFKSVFKAIGLYQDPPPPPDLSGAISTNREIAMEQLEFAREQAETADLDRLLLREREDEDREYAREIADKQQAQADDYYNFYKENYRPLEQEIADRAKKFGEENYQEMLAGQATTDIAKGYDQAREAQANNLSRMGINPNSGKFAALNNQLLQQQAADTAGAYTKSRIAGIDMKNAMLGNAVNVGNKFAANNQASTGLGLQGNAQASGITMNTQNAINQNAQGVNQAYAGALGANNSLANIMNAGYDNQLNAYNYGTQALASAGQSFGKLLGGGARLMAADGGKIDDEKPRTGEESLDKKGLLSGRGTGISDDIPAMLSKGEYVIPADVVKAKGVEFFDKLIQRYHTPAAVQRARGLKG